MPHPAEHRAASRPLSGSEPEELAETLLGARSVQEQSRELISRALAEGADDNLTALVVRVEASRGVVTVPKRHATRPTNGGVPPASVPPPASSTAGVR